MKFEADEFILDIPGDWEYFESDDPEQFSFHSAELGASIVISYFHAQVPMEKRYDAALAVIDSRIKGLDESGLHWADETLVELLEDGSVAYAKHTGETSTGVFRFESWVTEVKFINLWVGIEDRTPARAAAIFDDIFGGFSFYIP